MNNISIKIEYDAFFSDNALEDFKGIEELKKELSTEYVTHVKGKGVGRGGLVYDLAIEIIMNSSLEDFIKFILSGVAFDVIKFGVKNLALKPFMTALEKFNAANNNGVRVGSLRLKFDESDILLTSINKNGVFHIIPKLFSILPSNYSYLKHPTSKLRPDEIRVPLIQDSNLERIDSIKFRELSEFEDIELDLADDNYFGFWGLSFNINQQSLVYAVDSKTVTNDDFYTANIFDTYVRHKLMDNNP
ncbi:MAG: hypothetical protein ACK5QC_01565 [Bacteroidota bacterium]